MNAVDSSVVIAAFASWHEEHEAAHAALNSGPRLVAHVALEAFSVLTRLPAPHRAAADLVVEFLRTRFDSDPLVLPAAELRDIVRTLHRLGVSGGAVYDGLVALSAAKHGAILLTLDRRAEPTYRRCGVQYRLIAEDQA